MMPFAVSPVSPSLPVSPTGSAEITTAANPTGAAGFSQALGARLDDLQQLQSTADSLAVKAATGRLEDVHDYTIAAAQAKLATEMTVAVRNRAVEAFNEIMRMQA